MKSFPSVFNRKYVMHNDDKDKTSESKSPGTSVPTPRPQAKEIPPVDRGYVSAHTPNFFPPIRWPPTPEHIEFIKSRAKSYDEIEEAMHAALHSKLKPLKSPKRSNAARRNGRKGGRKPRDNETIVKSAAEEVWHDADKPGFKMHPRCRIAIRKYRLTIKPPALAKHVRKLQNHKKPKT